MGAEQPPTPRSFVARNCEGHVSRKYRTRLAESVEYSRALERWARGKGKGRQSFFNGGDAMQTDFPFEKERERKGLRSAII